MADFIMKQLKERDFRPMGPEELTVWRGSSANAAPTPDETAELAIVRAIAADGEAQWSALSPGAQREHAKAAYRVMLATAALAVPAPTALSVSADQQPPSLTVDTGSGAMQIAVHPADGVPLLSGSPPGVVVPPSAAVAVLVSDNTKHISALMIGLNEAGFTVLVPELLFCGVNDGNAGEKITLENDRSTAAFTHCYNASLFARRVA